MIKERRCKLTSVKKLADGRYGVTLSTNSLDRAGDTIDARGWVYANEVPLQLDHDYSVLSTVGRVVNIHVEGNALRGEIELAPAGISPTIDEVHRRFDAGLYPDVSVGFQPIEYDNSDGGYNFTKQELLELSLVSVPANSDARVDRAALEKWLGPKQSASINRRRHLTRAVDALEFYQKVGARHSAEDMGMLQQIHDTTIALGATCTPADDEKDIKIDGRSIVDAGLDIDGVRLSGDEIKEAIEAAIADAIMLATGRVQ